MESPDNIEADPYADNIVPVSEGEEQSGAREVGGQGGQLPPIEND